MKNMKLVVWVLFLGGAIGLGGTWARAEDVISKDVLTEGSYCHTKFESIREDTLARLNRSSRIPMTSSISMVPATMIL